MVVDLCGSSIESYNADTTTVIFSSGKVVGAVLMAMLVEKGLLSYDEKVSTYWPLFGQHGKDHLTVSDILRHESSLHKFIEPIPVEYTLTENIKLNKIGEVIERSSFYK